MHVIANTRIVALIIGMLSLPVGCGKSSSDDSTPPPTPTTSASATDQEGCCTNYAPNPFTPFRYESITAAQKATAKSLCTSDAGTWNDTKCSTDNMVGGCRFASADPPYTQWYPVGAFPGQDEEDLKAGNCTPGMGGSWVKP